jgi:NTE family protein
VNALVLSGGALFGAYQAGAWASIAHRFQPDLVVGTSVGAINGYLIASGATPESIVDRWRSFQPFGNIRLRPHWNPLDGWIDTGPLESMLREMCSELKPRIPFAVVAVDLFALRPVVFQTPDITWRHVAASCALLGLFPQYRIEGRRYTDGGLMGALPLWAAERLGATRIVGIHLLPRPPWLVRIPARILASLSRHRPQCSTRAAILAPEGKLGGIREACIWNRGNVDRWIEQGRRDADGLPVEEVFTSGTRSAESPTLPIHR